MRLYQVRILTDDFARSFVFYSQTLGLPAVWGSISGPYAGFGANDQAGVAIFGRAGMSEAAARLAVAPGAAEVGNSPMIVLQVDSVDHTYDQLRHKGVQFENEPSDYPGWTIRAVHLRDPDGCLIELFEPLPEDEWTTDVREENARSLERADSSRQ